MKFYKFTNNSLKFSVFASEKKPNMEAIWLSNQSCKLFESDIDIKLFSSPVISRLSCVGIPLTSYQVELRKQMVLNLKVPTKLILNVMARWVIDGSYRCFKDYRETQILSMKKFGHSVCDFVNAYGQGNLFLIVEIDKATSTVVAVELDDKSVNVYGLALLNLRQLTPSRWQGKCRAGPGLREFLENLQ